MFFGFCIPFFFRRLITQITNFRGLITRIITFRGLITRITKHKRIIIKVGIQDKTVMKTSVLLNGGMRYTKKKEITKLMIISFMQSDCN